MALPPASQLVRVVAPDAGPTRRRYCALLRRARAVGWREAKAEYLPRELENGRERDAVLDDLATFERLNHAAAASGIDPILAQSRRDAYEVTVRPTAILLGALGAAHAAHSGTDAMAALLLAGGLTLAGLIAGRVFVLSLVR